MEDGMEEVRVALIGGAPLLQAGITRVLEEDPRLKVVARAGGVEAAGSTLETLACDVIVVNTDMPSADTAAVMAALRARPVPARVVTLTDHEGADELFATLQVGAVGYGVRQHLWPEDIHAGILAVGRGLPWTCPTTTRHLLAATWASEPSRAAAKSGALSTREAEVLREAAGGASEEEMAGRLGLSKNSVKTYLRRIRIKLRAGTRADAVRLAIKQGLVPGQRPAPAS
jgi:DNA-binding NarL/FixJ family response regulator